VDARNDVARTGLNLWRFGEKRAECERFTDQGAAVVRMEIAADVEGLLAEAGEVALSVADKVMREAASICARGSKVGTAARQLDALRIRLEGLPDAGVPVGVEHRTN
jgi:hypothetical protein